MSENGSAPPFSITAPNQPPALYRGTDYHGSRDEARSSYPSDWLPSVCTRTTGPHFRTAGSTLIPKYRKPARATQRITDRSNRFEVTMDLPAGCLSGLSGCRERRRKWISEQITLLQQEENVDVSSHRWKGSLLTLSCYGLLPSHNLETNSALDRQSVVDSHNGDSSGGSALIKEDAKALPPTPPLSGQANINNILLSPAMTTSSSSIEVSRPKCISPLSTPEAITHGALKFRSGILTVKPDPSLLPASASLASAVSLQRSSATEPSLPSSLPPSSSLLSLVEINSKVRDLTDPASDAGGIGDIHSPLYGLDVEIYVSLATQSYEKSRRILLSQNQRMCYRISTHGSIDHLNLIPTFRQLRPFISPAPLSSTVDDACLLVSDNVDCIVLAHAGNLPQLSLVTLSHDKVSAVPLHRPFDGNRKPGVGAVAPLAQRHTFVSGGHDRIVHLWNVSDDLTYAEPRSLAIRHKSLVTSLLSIEDTSHKLLSSSADCTVQLYDLPTERLVNVVKVSNCVYHAHPTDSPFCILLEIAHHDSQFEIRDHRLVPENAVQRFGYTTTERHGRFVKGDTSGNFFACGSLDGRLRLWDLRNLRASPAEV